jgi:glutamate--cysteine ligase
MYLASDTDSEPVQSEQDLIATFHEAGKPRDDFRVGTEHELIGVETGDRAGNAPGYDGASGIGAVLQGFAARGWTPILEDGHIIALSQGLAQITIEPGGQFELAGRPVKSDLEFARDLEVYAATLAEISAELGIAWLSSGLRPFGRRDDIAWMPKARYRVMAAYMPGVGSRGLDMMLRTATVQSNLDFCDERDALLTMRCLLSVTSIMTAIWANSPIVDGQVSGYQSYRAWIWRDTDNARCGLLPFVFARDDLFTAYAQWALDVPMYFVYRGGYQPVSGLTFRQFLQHGWREHRATRADWALHLSTLFPEARLKKFIEVRGCDCGSLGMIAALGPFCRGLLYDPTARAAATALTGAMTFAQRQALADEVPVAGFAARAGEFTLLELARELIAIVHAGLQRVDPGVLPLLAPVEEIIASGKTQADRTIEIWRATATSAERIAGLAHPQLLGRARA